MTAGRREREMPGGASDETHADLLLERRQMAAHRGQRHAKMSACGGQTAGLGNGDKDIDGRETIHAGLSKTGRIFPILIGYYR